MRPLILISNDDGVYAPGIEALIRAVEPFADTFVVAPTSERSGSGQALTLTTPLRLRSLGKDRYGLNGSPADCVMFAMYELMPRKPDWVFSGINRGSNLGQDTLYSGTVAAAMEGCLQGIPAMAFSLKGAGHSTVDSFEPAVNIIGMIMEHLEDFREPASGAVLNVNVPDLAFSDIKGVQISGLGRRKYDTRFVHGKDPRGYDYYWLGGGGSEFMPIENSDCVNVENGYVSITALKPDHTDEVTQETLRSKVAPLLQAKFD